MTQIQRSGIVPFPGCENIAGKLTKPGNVRVLFTRSEGCAISLSWNYSGRSILQYWSKYEPTKMLLFQIDIFGNNLKFVCGQNLTSKKKLN